MTHPHPCEQIYEFFAKTAVEIFNREGFAEPQLFMVEVARPMIGQLVPTKWAAVANFKQFFKNDKMKDLIGPMSKSALAPTGAINQQFKRQGIQTDLVVQITEAWKVKVPRADINKTDINKIKPSKHPRREEVIIVSVFSLNFPSLTGMCPILENPRRAEYAAPAQAEEYFGRMSPHE